MKTTILLILFSIGFQVPLFASDDAAARLYKKAKEYTFMQQWDAAAQLYEQLVNNYPGSDHNDESIFWMGYCAEKAGDYQTAFQAFERVGNEYPESLWRDDALQHQIQVAEKLAETPGNIYHDFLREKLNAENLEIGMQSALALARLGDKSALPVLKELQQNKAVTLPPESESLIKSLEQSGTQRLDIENHGGDDSTPTDVFQGDAQPNERIYYFAENRFEQYKAMTKSSNIWSQHDLMLFGMWHILKPVDFEELYNLDSILQVEWMDRYWLENDPTPTTLRNEAREEFERRVKYSREFYDYYDGITGFQYAPWDARGEVYIKFGQPAIRKQKDDTDIWEYPDHNNLRLAIRHNVTNIFGRAIYIAGYQNINAYRPGTAANWQRIRKIHNEYIFRPGYFFSLGDYYDMMAGLNIEILDMTPRGIRFEYTVPVNNFEIIKRNGVYFCEYAETLMIKNQDGSKVFEKADNRVIQKPTRRDFDRLWTLGQEFELNLQPGEYWIGLRLDDNHSNKIGVEKIAIRIGAD